VDVKQVDSRRWVAPIVSVFVALTVRAIYLISAANEPTFLSPGMDAEIYRNWADAILAGTVPNEPFFRAPLYPYLISAFGSIFGDTFWPVRILQVVLSSLMAGGLSLLAFRWFGRRAAWIAGLGWALYGASIYFDGEGLIASLFTSGVIGLLLLLDRSSRSRWTLHLILLAIGFAALCALRANALAYAPILILGAWWTAKPRQIPASRRVLSLLVSSALVFLLLLPILNHNKQRGGGWTISAQGGINLFLGNRTGASGAYAVDPDFGPDWTQQQTESRAIQDEDRSLNASEVSDYYVDRAISFWRHHTGAALSLTFRKTLALINWRELGNNRAITPYLWHIQPIIGLLLIIAFPLVAIIGLTFSLTAWKSKPEIRPAILLAVMHGLTVIAFFVNARYRFPLSPVLVLLFAYGLDQLLPASTRPATSRSMWIRRGTVFAAVAIVVLIPRPIPAINEDQSWQLHQANALLRLDRIDEARNAFNELFVTHPNARNAHLNLGVIELELGNLTEARFQFEAELGLRPENALAWNNLGVVQEELGNPNPALQAYRRALEADPTHGDSRDNLTHLLTQQAIAAAEQERWELALSLNEEALRLDPDKAEYLFNHASLLAASGQFDTARISLQNLLLLHPNFEPAHEALQHLEQQTEKTPITE
jgi:tetratricopeptide (TPR) repeat protein